MRSLLLHASDWIGTVFHVGHLPMAPGTWASLVALLAWYLLPALETILYGLILVNLFLVGVIASAILADRDGQDDPSHVVIDEWVGMWIALISVPRVWQWMVGSFLLFRLFDIVKVFPARLLERTRGGWGIMLDDVAAGLYALVIVHIIRALA